MHPENSEERLDLDIMDAVAGLFSDLLAQGEKVADEFGVPSFFIKALHMIGEPMAMKELGRRMRCDPSFVTGIADMLEKRGLAVRESQPGDRRVKKLVLTRAGVDLKRQVEREILARMPWRAALSADERGCLLGLIRKMSTPLSADPGAACPAEEVTTLLHSVPPAG